MAKVNPHYAEVSDNYMFLDVMRRAEAFAEKNPDVEILKLGIGNTTEALPPSVIEGLRLGVENLSKVETYTGYGDEQGDERLREAVVLRYANRGVAIQSDEVFISDGAKPDCANIASIFSPESVVAIQDPVYPVYRDANIIGGRRVVYMAATEATGYVPALPNEHADLIYLCSPNNPTGAVMAREELKAFVDYALKHRAVIIFDAAYSEYIRDTSIPRSIYEIEGAKRRAIEIQSFSKSAGFTGVRLGGTIVPKALEAEGAKESTLNQYWRRRQTTMFNGASNIAQEGGLAVLSPEGDRETHAQVDYYMENARLIREGLSEAGFRVFGGEHAPYIWLRSPRGLSSWEFFDELLERAHVITTPGVGFGENGEGYMRVSAFGHRQTIEKAVRSIVENVRPSDERGSTEATRPNVKP